MFTLARPLAAALVLVGAGGLAAPDARAQDSNYILATASTGGTYYPVGVALSTLIKVKLQPDQGIGMSAINSAGSGENVRLLREDEAQFGILQGLFGYYARTGTGPVEGSGPQENLRAVTMLWQNVEHFILANDHVQEGTLSDFEAVTGEAMALGRQNSGTIGSNAAILDGFGIDIYEDYDLIYAGYGPSAEALQNGQVAGISTPAGVPVGAVSQLMATAGDSVTLLDVTEEEMATADGDRSAPMPPAPIARSRRAEGATAIHNGGARHRRPGFPRRCVPRNDGIAGAKRKRPPPRERGRAGAVGGTAADGLSQPAPRRTADPPGRSRCARRPRRRRS